MKYRHAKPEEKAAYANARELYPLHGFLIDADGREMPIEDLRAAWGKDGPGWEVRAPSGFHFAHCMTHSRLEHSLKECKENARYYPLAACVSGCGCGCERDA